MINMPTENPTDKFEGFVLAGGKSRRMGANKAFLRFDDKTFLERAAQALSTVCRGRVRLVLNQQQRAEEFLSFGYIQDIYDGRGALGGIHTALAHSKSEWTVILACDLPLVTGETISDLSKIALAAPDHIAAVVPEQADGRLQPLCAFYRPSLCLPPLEALLQSNESASVRDFLELIPVIYAGKEKTPINQKSVFYNVNTPADFELLSKKQAE